jgi:hypothetical protein
MVFNRSSAFSALAGELRHFLLGLLTRLGPIKFEPIGLPGFRRFGSILTSARQRRASLPHSGVFNADPD